MIHLFSPNSFLSPCYHTCSSMIKVRVIHVRKRYHGLLSISIGLLKWNKNNVSIFSTTFFIVTLQQHIKIRGGSRTAVTSKMENFVIIVNGWIPLTIITKRSILDVAPILDPRLTISFFKKIPFIMTKLEEAFIKVHWFKKYFQSKRAVKKQLFFKKTYVCLFFPAFENWDMFTFSAQRRICLFHVLHFTYKTLFLKIMHKVAWRFPLALTLPLNGV